MTEVAHIDPASGADASRAAALGIATRLQHAGFAAYWVGGCVRDLLLGRVPADYDVATSARPPEIELVFPHTVPVGRQFGVVVVIWEGCQVQVATFRADGEYRDGRRPEEVRFGDPRGDAERRDFTINGLFLDPITGGTHDWVGGRADLAARVIRAIGEPEARFREDWLRLLRAVRFAAQLGFEIEPATFAAVRRGAAQIAGISPERVRDELGKIFQPPHAGRGLELLRATGLLPFVLPEIAATETCDQSPDYHPEGTVYNHLRKMLDLMPAGSDPLLPWAVLLHDVAKPLSASQDPVSGAIHFYQHEEKGAVMAEEILMRLRFPRRETEAVRDAVRHHMQYQHVRQMRKATLRRLIARPTFALEMELHRLDCLGSHGRLDCHRFLGEEAGKLAQREDLVPPLLTGGDLIALGMQPGPAMGRLLAELREKQLGDELPDAAAALAWARTRISGPVSGPMEPPPAPGSSTGSP